MIVHIELLPPANPGGGWGVWPRGVSRPTPSGGIQTQALGGKVSRPRPRGVYPQHALRPAAGGTHPTGMHSYVIMNLTKYFLCIFFYHQLSRLVYHFVPVYLVPSF